MQVRIRMTQSAGDWREGDERTVERTRVVDQLLEDGRAVLLDDAPDEYADATFLGTAPERITLPYSVPEATADEPDQATVEPSRKAVRKTRKGGVSEDG